MKLHTARPKILRLKKFIAVFCIMNKIVGLSFQQFFVTSKAKQLDIHTCDGSTSKATSGVLLASNVIKIEVLKLYIITSEKYILFKLVITCKNPRILIA